MRWDIEVSEGERREDLLTGDKFAASLAAFGEHGCLLLRGAFEPALIDAVHREFLARFGALSDSELSQLAGLAGPNPFLEVGDRRFDISVRLRGVFADPALLGRRLVLQLVAPLLGLTPHLSSVSVVLACPGAAAQHVHRDHAGLFEAEGVGLSLPPHAVNIAVPLVDVDREIGPTGVWPGSHRWARGVAARAEDVVAEPLHRGDAFVLDYRTLHAGLPNRTSRPRPILYLAYARPWFFDQTNHLHRVPVDMTIEDFLALPPRLRPVLSRAYTDAIRAYGQRSFDHFAAERGGAEGEPTG